MKLLIFFVILSVTSFGCISTIKQSTPTAEQGTSILEKVNLGGIEQWILVHNQDLQKPIILVLHGGPGYAMMPLIHETNKELEEHFVIINWDQRGAGKSYSESIPKETMTLEQMLLDAHELTKYLKQRFDKKKIFLVGHSYGTILGMLLVKRYPNDYYAFVGIGQVVDVIENEQLSYDFALRESLADNNTQAISELEYIGRPDEQGKYLDDSGYELTLKWLEFYGGELYGKSSSEEVNEAILNSEIYANNQEQWVKGWKFSQQLFDDPAIWNLDLRTQVSEVKIPVYFFTGRYDYDTPSSLVEEYYQLLKAPEKGIIWFDNSAHFPFLEEAEKFNTMLIELKHIDSLQPLYEIIPSKE